MRGVLVACLLLGGCSRYLVSQDGLERTIYLEREQRARAVVPAIRVSDKAHVWVRSRAIQVESTPPAFGMVRARSTRAGRMTYLGVVLGVVGGAVFFGSGGAAFANSDPAAVDLDRSAASFALAFGAVSTISAAVLIGLGVHGGAEVAPDRPGYIYCTP